MRKVVDGVAIAVGICCFVIAFIIELFDFNLQSCWLFATSIFCIIVVFYPRAVCRIKRKYSHGFNFLIFANAFLLLALCVFLISNLIYFALKGYKFMEGYQIVVYPAILIFCLVETYIDYIINEKFKRASNNDYFD